MASALWAKARPKIAAAASNWLATIIARRHAASERPDLVHQSEKRP